MLKSFHPNAPLRYNTFSSTILTAIYLFGIYPSTFFCIIDPDSTSEHYLVFIQVLENLIVISYNKNITEFKTTSN